MVIIIIIILEYRPGTNYILKIKFDCERIMNAIDKNTLIADFTIYDDNDFENNSIAEL